MKILQNEITTNTTATAANSITTTKEKEKLLHNQQQQQQQQQHQEKRKAKTLKNKILQNVAQQQKQLQISQQTSADATTESNKIPSAVAMTDELSSSLSSSASATVPDTNESNISNSFILNPADFISKDLSKDLVASSGKANNKNNGNKNNNNNNNSNNHNNKSSSSNSDFIIAEAAKILLKNGLNGSNAAAAAAVATATATLLTAAANFQLPQQQQQDLQTQQQSSIQFPTKASTSSSPLSLPSKLPARDSAAEAAKVTTAAATAHAQLVAIAAAAAAVNATNNNKRLPSLSTSNSNTLNTSKLCPASQQLNNGTTSVVSSKESSSNTTLHFATPFKASSSSSNSHNTNTKSTTDKTMSSMDMGVIDYTINSDANNSNSNNSLTSSSSSLSPPLSSTVINLSTSATTNSHPKYINNSNKNSNHSHHPNHSDISRPSPTSQPFLNNHKHVHAPSGGASGNIGGRLQFFKDGKFILELARSKDGEKSGWVSVPRKVFRSPSAATSSTVTPAATASTSATIPSSLVAPPPAVVAGVSVAGVPSYPKNDCSNSLSFSDDNSSLQSSPWHRDHRWKQAAPRKNVSKEMIQFYHKPAFRTLTAQALLLAQRKRRKPYDLKTLDGLLYRSRTTATAPPNEQQQSLVRNDKAKTDIEVEKQSEEKYDVDKKAEKPEKIVDDVNSNNITNVSGATAIGAKEDRDSIHDEIDDKQKKVTEECNDVEMSQFSPSFKNEETCGDEESKGNDQEIKTEDMEKMNTSDCDINVDATKKLPFNGDVSNIDLQKQEVSESIRKDNQSICVKKQGDEEKRLTKQDTIKTRAKLTTIVQKLLDASASRVAANAPNAHQTFKSAANCDQQHQLNAGSSYSSYSTSYTASAGGGSKNQYSKVSPPSNAAASRLVEYHQQHVSPRKRILREFEKVSLEDNASVSGGKRSRAKGVNSALSTGTGTPHVNHTHSRAQTSPMSRPSLDSNCNSNNTSAGSQPKLMAPTTSIAPPTKLYSSYSINSLLGNGSSCTRSLSPSSSTSFKRSIDIPATITSNSVALNSYTSSSVPHHHNSYQSPKSPESYAIASVGGKSPSNSASKQKRSPPYCSPLRDSHSRSPTINVAYDYGRRSPRVTAESYNKVKFSGSIENNGSAPHHYSTAPNYYTQYLGSPQYVPPVSTSIVHLPSTSSSVASTSNSTSSSRSPRHHSSAFRATTPTSSTAATSVGGTGNANQNIPSTQKGDMSPQRSATASPRETTPRTVPKKTASIRRQFASPTSISTTTTNINNTNSRCLSPNMNLESRNEENDRRTPLSHHQHQHQQHQHSLLQRASPGSCNMQNSAALHPYSYMYATNNSHPQNVTHPVSAVSPTSASVSAAAAAAAAAATYIPVVGSPYYHPYISTLAAMRHPQMWMQHYQNVAAAAANPALLQASRHPVMLSAAAAGAAAARLSPPYHGYQYNGVSNAAALAAAAAAAAGFGSSTAASPSHHSAGMPPGSSLAPHCSILNPMTHGLVSTPSGTMHAQSGLALGPATSALTSSMHQMTDSTHTDLSKASKNNHSSSSSTTSSLASSSPLPGTGISGGNSSANSMYPISNKDEQSSDVPLNLSKH